MLTDYVHILTQLLWACKEYIEESNALRYSVRLSRRAQGLTTG